jgi:hypothetical protein
LSLVDRPGYLDDDIPGGFKGTLYWKYGGKSLQHSLNQSITRSIIRRGKLVYGTINDCVRLNDPVDSKLGAKSENGLYAMNGNADKYFLAC